MPSCSMPSSEIDNTKRNLVIKDSTTEYGSLNAPTGLKGSNKIVTVSYPERNTVQHKTSNFATFMHILRGSIGTGMLALPSACMSAGLWTGTIGIFVIGLCCLYCMHILVKSSHTLCARTNKIALDYGESMEAAFSTSPTMLNKFSNWAKIAANGIIIATELGTFLIYIVFIATNLKYVIHSVWRNDPDVRLYMLMVLAVLLPFVLIKHLKILAVFSMAGNILYIVAYVIVMQYVVRDLPDVSQRPAFNSTRTLPLFIGSALYAFDGISSLLPIENMMATPEDLIGWTGVLNTAIITTICIYTFTAFFGYLKFGSDVQGSISLNLPSNNALYLSVSLMFAVVIIITFPLLYYVIHTIVWPWVRNKLCYKNHEAWVEVAFRIIVVTFVGMIAIFVPQLDLMISFVGSIVSSIMIVIFPVSLDLIVRHADHTLYIRFIIVDFLLLCFGFIGFMSGSFVSLMEIIQKFRQY